MSLVPRHWSRIILFLFSFLCFFFLRNTAASLQPNWVQNNKGIITLNSSFLNNIQNEEFKKPSLRDRLLNQKTVYDFRQQLEDMNRVYEIRETYGLLDSTEKRAHYNQMRDFSRGLVREIKRYQIAQERAKLRGFAEYLQKYSVLAPVIKSLIWIGALFSVYLGRQVDLPLSEDIKLFGQTEGPTRSALFGFSSRVFTTSVSFADLVPAVRVPSLLYQPGPVDERRDRFRLTTSGRIDFLHLSISMAYLSTANVLAFSFNEQLTSHLVCSIGSIHPLGPSIWSDRPSGRVFSLAYSAYL